MKYKNKFDQKGISLVMLAFGLATLLGFAALAIDLGSAFNVQNELQKATNTAALAGASAYDLTAEDKDNMKNIKDAAEATFNLSKQSEASLTSAQIVGNIQIDSSTGAVRMQTKADAPTYFIGIIGIKNLEVNARAAAINYPVPYKIMNDLTGIPVAQQKPTIAISEEETTIGSIVEAYNLPPGKKIQLVLTLPLINQPGPEITVIESGENLDGYYVFVANNAAGPWYNISSTGKTTVNGTSTPVPPGPYHEPNDPPGVYKFFGSGKFDLQGTGIENARYVIVLCDGTEDGFDKTTYTYHTSQAVDGLTEFIGAEIDAVIIGGHAIAISYNDLSTDENGNGVIDAYDNLFGSFNNPGSMLIDQ